MKIIKLAQLAALALLLSNFNTQLSSAFAQGSLTPPGPPGATMLTLSQIEPRTPISSVPFTITRPGSYYLTTNVTATVSNAITIVVSGVSLDLNDFTISSTVPSAANGGTAILLSSGLSDITIAHGHIRSGVTNNGSGVYSGSGFGNGIAYSGIQPVNLLVSHVSISGCLYDGVELDNGNSTIVESSTVQTVGNDGIVASTIKQSSTVACGGNGIYGDQVSDCRGQSSGSGIGVYATTTAQNCYGSGSSDYGIYASTALNCYGAASAAYGVVADSAENCQGYSSGSAGIYIYGAALNCYGYGGSGDGISGALAENCYGYSNAGGGGIVATAAMNCYGYNNGGGDGVFAGTIATGCYGDSVSGTGISAYIANSCYSNTGDSAISYKYNMP